MKHFYNKNFNLDPADLQVLIKSGDIDNDTLNQYQEDVKARLQIEQGKFVPIPNVELEQLNKDEEQDTSWLYPEEGDIEYA